MSSSQDKSQSKPKPVADAVINESESDSGREVDSDGDGESRLTRWSRRKRQAGQTAVIAEPSQTPAVTGQSDHPDMPPQAVDNGSSAQSEIETEINQGDGQSAHELTDADMPDIASLTADSDFKPFMSKGVSHALRRKALRKLFASPFFQIRDGLDDYDDDFTSFAPLGDTVTADMKYADEYKEKLRKEAELEEQAKLQAQGEQHQALEDQPDYDASASDESNADETSADETSADVTDEASEPERLQSAQHEQADVELESETEIETRCVPRDSTAVEAGAGDDGCEAAGNKDGRFEVSQSPRRLVRSGSSIDDVGESEDDF